MSYKNYAQVKAIQDNYKKKFLKLNSNLTNDSGIYFLTRINEDGIVLFYIGQAINVLNRLASHMTGWQHIDLSLKKRGLYSEDNPYGWNIDVKYYPKEQLDEMEQYWILEYQKRGYQARYNKTAGGQGEGKSQINEYRPTKTYRDGLAQEHKNLSKEIAHLFDLHLEVTTKKNPPTVNQQKALDKFYEFLNYYKNN